MSEVDEWGKVPIWWGRAIARQPRHHFNALHLAVVLSRKRDLTTNECFPSVATLMTATGLSSKRLSEALGVLVAAKILTIRRRQRKSNLYTINVTPGSLDATAPDLSKAHLDTTVPDTSKNLDATAPGSLDATAPGILMRQRPHTVSPSVSPSIISNDDGLIKNQSRDEIADALRANGVANADDEANEIRRSIGLDDQRALLFLEAYKFAVSHQGYHSPIGFAINRASAGLGAPPTFASAAKERAERYAREHAIPTVTDAQLQQWERGEY